MKSIFNNFIFIVVIILQFNVFGTLIKVCKISELQTLGNKIFCESKNGISVSCIGPEVKKVYIQCQNGYFNENNITQKIINCLDDGNWSDETLFCSAECTEFPKELKLLDSSTLVFPTSYAEFSRKKPSNGKINEFPGIILSERQILTKSNYFDNEEPTDFYVIIYKSNEKLKKYDFHMEIRKDEKWDPSHEFDQLCILTIVSEESGEFPTENIKYDNDTKPACKTTKRISEFGKTDFIQNSTVINYTYEYWGCFVPKVNNKKVRMTCVDFSMGRPPSTMCSDTVFGLEMRCQIGYKNPYLKPNNDVLNRCVLRGWELYGEQDDCELVCGEIENNIESSLIKLIYKGNKTDIVNAPWHVGIYTNNTDYSAQFQQVCGGTIIHSNVIISAAHCFHGDNSRQRHNPSNYLIAAGKTDRSYEVSEPFCYYARVKYINFPIHYQSHPLRNDIAVLILEDHLEYTAHIKPVCIDWDTYPSSHNIYMNRDVEGQIVGWGATSQTDQSSTTLLAANLTTISNDECRKLVDPNLMSEISGDKFCAISKNSQTPCKGDSGGGFITKMYIRGRLRYFLTGIISTGIGKNNYCSDGFITMFTNVKLYEDFIKKASNPYFVSPIP